MDFVRIEDLDSVVENTIRQIRRGVYNVNQANIVSRLPKTVDFDLMVIAEDGWQALEVEKSDNRVTSEKQGGKSEDLRVDDTKTNDQSKSTDIRESRDETVGVEDSKTTDLGTGTETKKSNSTETRKSSDSSNSTDSIQSDDTSTQVSEETQNGANRHIQNDSDEVTHIYGEV